MAGAALGIEGGTGQARGMPLTGAIAFIWGLVQPRPVPASLLHRGWLLGAQGLVVGSLVTQSRSSFHPLMLTRPALAFSRITSTLPRTFYYPLIMYIENSWQRWTQNSITTDMNIQQLTYNKDSSNYQLIYIYQWTHSFQKMSTKAILHTKGIHDTRTLFF